MHAVKKPPIDQDAGVLVLPTILLLGVESSTLACLLPCLNLTPRTLTLLLQLVVASTELGDSLFSEKLLQCPLLNVLRLIVLQLGDE